MKMQLKCCGVAALIFALLLMFGNTSAGEDKKAAKGKKVTHYHRTFQRVSLSSGRVPKLLEQALGYTVYAKKPTTIEDVLAMSDKKIRSLITAKAAFEQCRCPKCGSPDVQRGEIYQLSDWHISDPLRIRCKFCKEIYPNEKYPENAELHVKTPTGKDQVYKYYRDKKGRMIFLTATARFRLNGTLVAACRRLAELWLITKEAKYAHKAIVIMNRFREVWPDIPVHGFVGNDQYRVQFLSRPPYIANQVGKISGIRKRALDLELIKAYDLLYESDEFEKMSRQLGYNVRAKIEEGFRRAIYMEITELGAPIPDWMVRTAYCLKDAPTMHWAVRKLFYSFCAGEPYCLDGQDPRGDGYHRACGGYLNAVNNFVRGYSDPAGYVDIVDGTRFDNLNIIKLNPKLWGYLRRKTAEAKPKFRFPNGYVAAVHNAWSTNKKAGPALTKSRPWLFPGFGHAILGRGKGKNQIQAHLHFSCLSGHGDADMLNLILFAKGHEFLPDFGYCHQKTRAWSCCTLGHNTVLIDQKEQDFRRGAHNFGNLLFYDVSKPKVLVADAEGKRAYRTSIHNVVPDLETYRRRIMLVPISQEDAYVVDIFRVKGGKMHDWVFHTAGGPEGSEAQQIDVALDLKPRKGTLMGPGMKFEDVKLWLDEVHEDRDSEYGLVDNLRSAKTKATWSATIRFKSDPEAGLKLTMLGGPEREIIVGDAPNPRANNKDPKTWKTAKTRILLARERLNDGLYVAVWEPFRGQPFIERISPLKAKNVKESGFVGLKVQLKSGRVDYVLISDGRHALKTDGIEFQGRYGLISEQAGAVKFMYLGGGTRIAKAGKEVRGRDITGKVTGVKSYANKDDEKCLLLALDNAKDLALVTGGSLPGRVIRITHHDGSTHFYTIEKIEKRGDVLVVHTDEDPGFSMTCRNVAVNEPTLPLLITRFLYYPVRTVEGGENRFTIFGSNVLSGQQR